MTNDTTTNNECTRDDAMNASWSGRLHLPHVGDRILVGIGFGTALGTIAGYRIQDGWAGVLVDLDTACDDPNVRCYGESHIFAFGCDLLAYCCERCGAQQQHNICDECSHERLAIGRIISARNAAKGN